MRNIRPFLFGALFGLMLYAPYTAAIYYAGHHERTVGVGEFGWREAYRNLCLSDGGRRSADGMCLQ